MKNDKTKVQPVPGEVGIYKLADEVYHSLPLCSSHALGKLADATPMHLKHEREHPSKPTEAMRFGSALHTLVLEPEAFRDRHPVTKQCEAKTKKGTQCTSMGKYHDELLGWVCGTHATDDSAELDGSITPEQLDTLNAMRDAIMRHTDAAKILKTIGANEIAAFWDRQVEGDGWTQTVRCKLKADALRHVIGTVADIKTAESAARRDFESAIVNYGYARQAAFYQDGFAAHGITIEHFVFIVVEKTAPHGVQVFRVQEDAIAKGREQNEQLIRLYADCERRGVWPGYSEEVQDVSMPAWAMRRAGELV